MNQIDAVRAQRDKLAPLVKAALDFVQGRDMLYLEEDRARGDALVATAHKASLSIADIFLKLGHVDEAQALFSQTLGLGVEVGMLNARIGSIHLLNQNYLAAALHFENALRLEPDVADHAFHLGRALFRSGRHDEAAAALEAALALSPQAVQALNELAILCLFRGETERALTLAQRALDIDPDSFAGHFNLGQAHQALGDAPLARQAFLRALEIEPDHADAHRLLGMLSTYTAGDGRIAQMQAIFERPDAPDQQRCKIGFALYKAYDDTGRHDQAFACLSEANRLRRRDFRAYRVEDDLEQMQAIEDWFAAGKDAGLSGEGLSLERPIFVVGLPRSGTSLTEQILASHPDVYGAGEVESLSRIIGRNFFTDGQPRLPMEPQAIGSGRLAEAGRRYIDPLLKAAGGRTRIVDKMPVNFLWVGHILMMFPKARIIITRRNAVANCFAAYASYFPSQGMAYCYDLEEMGRYYNGYQRLTEFWARRYPEAVMALPYETLTEHQERETRRLLEFAGLPWNKACLSFEKAERPVITLSAAQVRQGMYSGVDRKTAHYQAHLGALTDVLARGPSYEVSTR